MLQGIASREGFAVVFDGTNHDDRLDIRPGRKAAKELGIRSPFADLGFGKDLIRQPACERGLPNWDDPACACLASRIPYGQPISAERLQRLGGVETGLRALGFRVRLYQGVTIGALSLPKDAGAKMRGKKRHPNIEDDVIIYSGATILGGDTTIGARSIIGGNVWLTESVPPDTQVLMERPKLVYKNGALQENA